MSRKPAAQECIGFPAENFGPRKPPADAFGVALRVAKQRRMERVAFARPLAITLSWPKRGVFARRTSRHGCHPTASTVKSASHVHTYNVLAKGALLACGALGEKHRPVDPLRPW